MSWLRNFVGFPAHIAEEIKKDIHLNIENHCLDEVHEDIARAEHGIARSLERMNPNLHVTFTSDGHFDASGGNMHLIIAADVGTPEAAAPSEAPAKSPVESTGQNETGPAPSTDPTKPPAAAPGA